MIKVAITGFIGNGKTFCSNIFNQKYKVPLFNADLETKQLYYNQDIKNEVESILNTTITNDDKSIDFKKIANILFNDINQLKTVTNILHPLLYEKYKLFCQEHENEKYTLFESALIYQSNSVDKFDKIILVHSDLNTVIERVIKRDNCNRLDVLQKLLLQRNNLYVNQLDYKNLKHDFLLKNDETIHEQINQIHNSLTI
jgi:dephospho-CoA kinase